MLLAFTGQAIANTAMSYAEALCVHETMTMNMSSMSHSEKNNMAMSHAKMAKNDTNQDEYMDCCQEQCQCPMNGCVNLSLLFNTYFDSDIIPEQKIYQSPEQHQSQFNSSLYRPPIS
jgi:hypothetical protein